jgi:hypothetical protein
MARANTDKDFTVLQNKSLVRFLQRFVLRLKLIFQKSLNLHVYHVFLLTTHSF